jgi:hypothetical protein
MVRAEWECMKLSAAQVEALRIAKANGIVSNHGGYGVKRSTLAKLREMGLLEGGFDMVTTGSGRSGHGRSITYVDSYGSLTVAGIKALEEVR